MQQSRTLIEELTPSKSVVLVLRQVVAQGLHCEVVRASLLEERVRRCDLDLRALCEGRSRQPKPESGQRRMDVRIGLA